MATFSVRFLGCKVSFADAQAVRERLLVDGHTEVEGGGDVAVVNTCCVTHEAVSKSRQAVSRAARAHRQVYATGCGARLDGALEARATRRPRPWQATWGRSRASAPSIGSSARAPS